MTDLTETAKRKTMPSVLILGGTGAMGKSLVEILAKTEAEVCVTSRKDRQSRWNNVSYLKGNAKDNAFLQQTLSRHYDAIVDFMSYSTAQFRQRYKLLLASTRQYIFISSARVYAESSAPLTEESPRLLDVCDDKEYLKTDEYALSKARQEDMLTQSGSDNYTIVRPSLTYNSNRLQLAVSEKEEWLYRALKGRSIVLPYDIMEKRNSMAWGGDVAAAIAKLVLNKRACGQTVQIASEEALSWADVLTVYQDVLQQRLGNKAKVVYVPKALEMARKLQRYYQIKYARAINRTFDCSKLKSIIGDSHGFISPVEGLRRCLNDFLDNPQFGSVSTLPHAYFDKVAGERTSLSELAGMKERLKYLLTRYTPIDAQRLRKLLGR